MKKQITIAIVSILFAAAAMATAAQTHNRLTVNVPFDFYVKSQKFTAGEYTVQASNPTSPQVNLILAQKDGEARGMVAMIPMEVKGNSSTATLVFNRYGSDYFLTEIRNPSESFGGQIARSKMEANLARTVGDPKRETVALSNQR